MTMLIAHLITVSEVSVRVSQSRASGRECISQTNVREHRQGGEVFLGDGEGVREGRQVGCEPGDQEVPGAGQRAHVVAGEGTLGEEQSAAGVHLVEQEEDVQVGQGRSGAGCGGPGDGGGEGVSSLADDVSLGEVQGCGGGVVPASERVVGLPAS